jgi:hypothetical protein
VRERAVATGAISVEISARFDGSVVSVHHLVVGPRGLTRPTRLLFAAGGLGLAAALVLLGAAARGATGHAFTVAFVAAVVLAASCLPLAWLRRLDERQPRDFTVGPGRGVDLPLAEHLVPEPRFALVRMTDGGFELRPPHGPSRAIEVDDRAHMILGATVLQITAGLPPRRYRLDPPTHWLARITEGALGVWIAIWLCILLPIGVALLGALYTQHDQRPKLTLDPADAQHARVAIGPAEAPTMPAHASRTPPARPARALATVPREAAAAAAAAQAAASSDEESGSPSTEPAQAAPRGLLLASAGAVKLAPSREEVRRRAHEMAVSSPLLGLLKGSMASAGSALGSASAASGAQGSQGAEGANASDGAGDPMGSLTGDEVGEAYGVGGVGLAGSGEGGGGTGEGTIGLGDIGTIGHGSGTGSGSGYGIGEGGLGGRRASAPDVVAGAAEVRGVLDKEMIRRVVRAHINEVRFCYEQQLQEQPTLEGRVSIDFLIAESGDVMTATAEASTLARPEVGACIAGAVRRWTFPSVKKHGVTEVHYPFALHAVGP